MPEYIVERLSPSDRVLFEKLMRVGLESAWSLVTAEGYPQNFINELSPLETEHADGGTRPHDPLSAESQGRAREAIRRRVRSSTTNPQRSRNPATSLSSMPAERRVPGVSGGVTTIRFLVRGGAGLVIDGAMRDVPELEAMPIQTYMRRGHASSVAPLMMSVDYQVPVRIGSVTVIPGDILVGESTGILVIPAAIAEKVANTALEHDEQEEFQRELLLSGESIVGVYRR